MPTNDGRSEVAARLRNNADQKPSWVIPWAAFNDAYEHEGAELINRLADLIEPEERTCYIEHVDEDLFHLSCGHVEVGYITPLFCPWCGAKVVDDHA